MPSDFTEAHITADAGTDRVFAELADGRNYVGRVVGATHVRDVDADRPAPGRRIQRWIEAGR